MSVLKRLFGIKNVTHPARAEFNAPLAPDSPFFAVGDVHGCLPKMRMVLDQIAAHNKDAPVVFVGDYVDRGEQSAAVLRALFARRDDPNMICLRGNHEDMLLDFIADPKAKGTRWLHYGGMQTLASFGIGGISQGSKGPALVQAATDLLTAMGENMHTWLTDLPSMWQSGNVAVVHAGADPNLPVRLQAAKTLAWGHKNFESIPRQDGVWVLHGHTIVRTPYAKNGRIAIDTGAYATGRLTAAYVTQADVTFLQT